MIQSLQSIDFILNDSFVSTTVAPGMLALDYLRQNMHLTGTKEGCKEGDCGACTVILGRLEPQGEMVYRPMTSCLLPVGELHGKHLVTVEGLSTEDLSPVQKAMVDCGGTQCGYCTPGFIVSMTSWLMDDSLPLDKEGCKQAISGNLCRCTGYRSIKAAGEMVAKELKTKLVSGERIAALCDAGALPAYFMSIPQRLAKIPGQKETEETHGLLIAGGTDIYVQRGEDIPDKPVRLVNRRRKSVPVQLDDGVIFFDAAMDFETFARDPIIQENIPEILRYTELIASWPVRTRSTIGGNICNASPIADMTCLMLALDAKIRLKKPDGSARFLPLSEFYLGYKQLNKESEEEVYRIQFSTTKAEDHINWEKVSKRSWLDIATVNSAIRIRVRGNKIVKARIAFGGVAPIPFLLRKATAFLEDKALLPEVILEAANIAQTEFEPISDVRGSAQYKRLLARQLFLAHFTRLFPESINEDAIYATLR